MGKTARKILFDFDSLIDTQIGYARWLQANHPDLLVDWAKTATYEEFCKVRVEQPYFSLKILPVNKPFYNNSNNLELFAEVYDQVFREHYDELIQLSPKVPQTKQIISIYDDPDYSNYMDCHLLARSEKEDIVLRREFPNHTVLLVKDDDKFNYSQYARVFVGNYGYLWHMEGTEFTRITVLSYPDNFELIKDDEGRIIKKINTHALKALGGTNQFELLEIHF